jgi:hypothetical protein
MNLIIQTTTVFDKFNDAYAKYYSQIEHLASDEITYLLPKTELQRDVKNEPTLFSKTIQLSTEVRYLGLTLDKGLTWGA